MSEPLLRDYRKTEAERREVVRQKFLSLRGSLAPEARAILDRSLNELHAVMAEGDNATERRRQELLDQKAACLRHMSPQGREYFEREIVPDVRNGKCPAVVDPGCQAELEAENRRPKQVKEILRKIDQVFRMAIARRDLTNANRAIQNFTRIQQLERGAGYGMDEIGGFCPPGPKPLPGRPGGRPFTEQEEKRDEEMLRLQMADRMAIYEAWGAALRYVELGGNLADLVKPAENATLSVPTPEAATSASLATPEGKQ